MQLLCVSITDDSWIRSQIQPLLDIGTGKSDIDVLQYLAPRNLNADVKRDLKPMYDIIQQRSKQAINRMVNEKIRQEQEQEQLEGKEQDMNGQ
jgi:hypothetical protein